MPATSSRRTSAFPERGESPEAPQPPRLAAALLGRRAALWLALGALATRLPGFHGAIINIDECDFVLVARMMRTGALPYVGVVDIKPPLTYVVFWVASFFGGSVLPARVLAASFVLGTVLLVRAAATLWTDDARVGAAAGWCALIATLCELPWASSEVFMNLPVAAALYLFVRAERSRAGGWDLAAGLAIAAATLFRHQAGALLAALGMAIAWAGLRRREAGALARLALLGVGFAVPWAVTLGLYAALGHLPELVDWVFTRNFAYVGNVHAGIASRLGAVLFAVGGGSLLYALALREAARVRRDAIGLAFALALVLTAAAVGLGGRLYQHYFLQLAPVLGLLAGGPLCSLVARWSALAPRRRSALTALLALPFAGWAVYGLVRIPLCDYPSQDAKTGIVARWLRDHTAPSDRLFVWGDFTPIYYQADRLPGTRYLMTAVHMGNFDPAELPPGFDVAPFRSQRDIDATLRDLDAHRPAWVVDTAPADIHSWSHVPLQAFPSLAGYVAEHYAEVAAPAGARVYRRRDGAGTP
jgi:hypothetical protein